MTMQRRRQRLLSVGLALFATTSTAVAQDLLPKAGPQQAPILIRNVVIHTVSGQSLPGASILFADGVVQEIYGRDQLDEVDLGGASAVGFDGARMHLYPGMICATSTLGLTEVSSVDMTNDIREAGTMKPEVRSAVAMNPDTWHLPVARRNGVLIAGVMPDGGTIPGWAASVRLDGWTWKDMTIDDTMGLVIRWPFMGSMGGGRFGRRFGGGGGGNAEQAVQRLTDFFEAAAAYLAAREADPTVATDLRMESMAPAVRGEKPLFITATTQEQIESAVRWCAERELRLVLVGGRDAGRCLDLLKEHDVFVAVGKSHRLPHRRDLSVDTAWNLPMQLEEAGIRWCMTMPGESADVRNLPYEAAACVARGLSKEVALRSVTLSAAQCLGIDDRYGSIEKGKSATFFVADGDPLELTTKIRWAFIDGRLIDLRDKQTELAKKYREKYRQLGILEESEEE